MGLLKEADQVSCPSLYVVLVLQGEYIIYYETAPCNKLSYRQKNCMPEPEQSKVNILIIDNSFLIIERLINILIGISAVKEIFKATDFAEAVDILKEKTPHVVLLDIQLPGKNGLELLKYIVKSYPEIKVIILTNHVSVYYQRLCEKLGAGFFIDKSKDFDRIPEIVSAL